MARDDRHVFQPSTGSGQTIPYQGRDRLTRTPGTAGGAGREGPWSPAGRNQGDGPWRERRAELAATPVSGIPPRAPALKAAHDKVEQDVKDARESLDTADGTAAQDRRDEQRARSPRGGARSSGAGTIRSRRSVVTSSPRRLSTTSRPHNDALTRLKRMPVRHPVRVLGGRGCGVRGAGRHLGPHGRRHAGGHARLIRGRYSRYLGSGTSARPEIGELPGALQERLPARSAGHQPLPGPRANTYDREADDRHASDGRARPAGDELGRLEQ